jgi:WD40 repeat protein
VTAGNEVATLAPGLEKTVVTGHAAPITSLAFARDGSHLLSASLDKSVKMWRVREAAKK